MKERPILFSGPMVRALLTGSKTQTRRIVKPCAQFRAWDKEPGDGYEVIVADDMSAASFLMAGDQGYTDWVSCPYGKPGDRLWVREAWASIAYGRGFGIEIHYRADGHDFYNSEQRASHRRVIDPAPDKDDKWRPVDGFSAWRGPLFMPRWASRITLEVTGVRVQRLQSISEKDAEAEGVIDEMVQRASRLYGADASRDDALWQLAFCDMWNDAHGCTDKRSEKRGDCPKCWNRNPFVWAVEFKLADVAGQKWSA